MKYVRCLAVFLALWAVWSAAGANLSTSPTTARSVPSTAPVDEVAVREIRAEAYTQLLAGKFQAGLDLLEKARKLRPDALMLQAEALTIEYLLARREAEAERRAEMAAAVRRARLARLAEKHRAKRGQEQAGPAAGKDPAVTVKPAEKKADAFEKLFEHIEAIADAMWAVNRQLLGNSTSSQPSDSQQVVDEQFDRAEKELSSAEALVGSDEGEWEREHRNSAEQLRRALARYRTAWQTARLPKDRPALKAAAEKVQEALLDLGVLASRDPFVAALTYAREAKELASDKEEFLRQDWVRQLIADAEKRGQELLSKGEWADALTIYGHAGLSDLDENNADYQEKVKQINHYVRVLSLYGQAPTTKPTEPRWGEMIAGIDAKMVRKAISQIDANYVETPDYRRIGVAALSAVKVLVDTAETARQFSVLKDETKRAAFLKGVDEQIAQLKQKSTVDHLHVKSALNRLLDLNDETVCLPPEVIDMEFAEGMTAELDRFTAMIWPYEMEDFNKRTIGYFFGIGVKIRKDPGKPIEVVTPLADTPAFRARIQAGDLIIRVDGQDTSAISINKAVKLITGPRHTNVTLTIQRPGVAKPFDRTIVRDEIHIQTVKGWRRLPDGKWDHFLDRQAGIAYLRVTQFTSDTAEELRQALQDLRQAKVKGIIVDMRLNPGGLLNAAVQVADEFLAGGLIVETKGRNVREAKRSATPAGGYQQGKLVVLVNRISASATEIVSGALKDWGRAVVVGERTYGKASVQRLLPVRANQALLKLTTAYYYLPSGNPLHRTNGAKVWGVDPHVAVGVTVRQMGRWAEIRRETELLKTVDPDTLASLLAQQLDEDLQLQAALLMVRLQLLSDATQSPPAVRAGGGAAS